ASADNIQFSRFVRYPTANTLAAGDFPYDGARLRTDVSRYVYSSSDGAPATTLPLRQLPAPSLAALRPAFRYGDAGLLLYQYFHYVD
ncbi:hypothetical protein MMA53_24725, partial [Salmonella enterica]|nr:hypothetical protein [Salmonella enterica]